MFALSIVMAWLSGVALGWVLTISWTAHKRQTAGKVSDAWRKSNVN